MSKVLDDVHPFDQYELGRELGRGAFSVVNECVHQESGEQYAVKIIPKESIVTASEETVRNEITALQKCNHPNIIKLVDVCESSTNVYLVMELSKGGDLFDKVIEKDHLSCEEAFGYFHQILGAVRHLHSRSITHRDLKLENILLSEDGSEIQVIDLGLSSEGDAATIACGSPNYAAPEILIGRSHSPACDIWSMGVILYTMCFGEFPYTCEKNNPIQTYETLQHLELKFSADKDICPDLKDLIKKMLHADPEQRISLDQIENHPWVLQNASLIEQTSSSSTSSPSSVESKTSEDNSHFLSISIRSKSQNLSESYSLSRSQSSNIGSYMKLSMRISSLRKPQFSRSDESYY